MDLTTLTPARPPRTLRSADSAPFVPRLRLSDQELSEFDRRGFHIHEQLFSDGEVQAIREASERVANGEYATGKPPDCRMWEPSSAATAVCKIDNSWKSDQFIQATVTDRRLGVIASQLIGANGIRLWHDQYLRKPGNGGGIVSWHQDWMFWQDIDRCRTVTCWIALCDVEVDMGPMVFLEGSHLLGLQGFHKPKDWTGDNLPPPNVGADLRRVPVLVKAGQVSFHHGNTVHASDCNVSKKNRYSLVSHVMASDCQYRPATGHMCITAMKTLPDTPLPGERFHGAQFPWIYQADT
jgi:hypothetical protein